MTKKFFMLYALLIFSPLWAKTALFENTKQDMLDIKDFKSGFLNLDFNTTANSLNLSSNFINENVVSNFKYVNLGDKLYVDSNLPTFRVNLGNEFIVYYPALQVVYDKKEVETLQIKSDKINGNINDFTFLMKPNFPLSFKIKKYIKKIDNASARAENINTNLNILKFDNFIDFILNGMISNLEFEIFQYVYKFTDFKLDMKVKNLDKNFYNKTPNLRSVYELLSNNLEIDILNLSLIDINNRDMNISGKFGANGYDGDLTKAIYMDLNVSFDKDYLVLVTKGDDRALKFLFSSGILIENNKKATINIKTKNNNIFINDEINLNLLIKGTKYAKNLENIGLKIDELDAKHTIKNKILDILNENNASIIPRTFDIFTLILDKNSSDNNSTSHIRL